MECLKFVSLVFAAEGESRPTTEHLRVQWEDGGVGHEGREDSKPDSHPAPAQPDAATHQPPPSGDPPRPPDDAWLRPGPVSHSGGLPCGRRQWGSPATSSLRHQPSTVSAVPSCSLVPGRHLQGREEAFHPTLRDTRFRPPGWLHEAGATRLCHHEPEDDTRLRICAAHHRRSPPSPTSRYHSDHRLWARNMAGRASHSSWSGREGVRLPLGTGSGETIWRKGIDDSVYRPLWTTAGPPSSAVGATLPPTCRDYRGLRATGGRLQGTWWPQARRPVRLRPLHMVRIWHLDSSSVVGVQQDRENQQRLWGMAPSHQRQDVGQRELLLAGAKHGGRGGLRRGASGAGQGNEVD